jgi:hypothetical protein
VWENVGVAARCEVGASRVGERSSYEAVGMMPEDAEQRIAALESKVQELDTLVNLALRLLAVEKPVSTLLERYGATRAEDLAMHALLDDVAKRAEQGGMYAPSLSGFQNEVDATFPTVRGDRQFVSLLVDTLKLDRPAYQKLHAYAKAHGWPGK